MSSKTSDSIHLSIDQNMVPEFFYFLEKGIRKEVYIDVSIRDLLFEQLDVSMEYIDNRIKTLFLNYNPVGDIYETLLNDGSILALSAAMPGLAGATFRRMENAESGQKPVKNKKDRVGQKKGIIVLKFFNMILKELGPGLLESGVLIPKNELSGFFTEHSEHISTACQSLKVDDTNRTVEEVCEMYSRDEDDLINLYVSAPSL